jgi:hypothetical protein
MHRTVRRRGGHDTQHLVRGMESASCDAVSGPCGQRGQRPCVGGSELSGVFISEFNAGVNADMGILTRF